MTTRRLRQIPARHRARLTPTAVTTATPQPPLTPTAHRLRICAAILRGEVYSYAWTEKAWRKAGVDEEVVTRWVNDLRRHEYAVKPAGELAIDRLPIQLTVAGRAWLRRHGPTPPVDTITPAREIL